MKTFTERLTESSQGDYKITKDHRHNASIVHVNHKFWGQRAYIIQKDTDGFNVHVVMKDVRGNMNWATQRHMYTEKNIRSVYNKLRRDRGLGGVFSDLRHPSELDPTTK